MHGLACLAVLKEKVPNFTFHAAAGLSLGEFTAHAAAGTFDFETGLGLVAKRSQAMQEACEKTQGGMAAVIGGEENRIRELAAAADVDVANFNSPGQIVLSGETSKIALAVSIAKEYGARKAVELQVAGAFHSRLMESAYLKLKEVLKTTPIKAPNVPVVCNVDAVTVSDPDSIRRALADQVTGSVTLDGKRRIPARSSPLRPLSGTRTGWRPRWPGGPHPERHFRDFDFQFRQSCGGRKGIGIALPCSEEALFVEDLAPGFLQWADRESLVNEFRKRAGGDFFSIGQEIGQSMAKTPGELPGA